MQGMAINSVIQNYIGSLIAEEALAPSAPAIRTPDPFSEEERADIGFEKFGTRIVDRDPDSDLSTATSTRRESDGDTRGYSGPLDVSRIYRQQGATLPEQGFFDKKFGSKPTIDKITGKISYGIPRGMSPFLGFSGIFAQLGGAASRRNLERIYEKIQAGEEGYGLAMLNGRVVGVGPGPMEGSTVLSGVLPEGLTSQQRYQLGQSILAAGAPTDEPPPPQFSFEERKAQYEASGESPDGSSSLLSGGNINIVQDDAGRPVTSGGKPVTTSAGQYVDPALLAAQADAMKAAAQQDKAPTQPAPAPAPAPKPDPIDQNLYGDRGGGDRGGSDRGGSGQAGTGSGPGERFRASGGTVGFAEGGNTQKDPIQRTGFVEGPPQEYAKGTTVADTENLRVREGSFVINAPMTEKLQKAGVLPKGNQKRKAAKGGKMMEVALSKGEYVVEPKDVPKFGGYNFLEAVNDMGKPEVERRQALKGGGFVTPPERSPRNIKKEQMTQLADQEFANDLEPYFKENPLARLGYYAYLQGDYDLMPGPSIQEGRATAGGFHLRPEVAKSFLSAPDEDMAFSDLMMRKEFERLSKKFNLREPDVENKGLIYYAAGPDFEYENLRKDPIRSSENLRGIYRKERSFVDSDMRALIHELAHAGMAYLRSSAEENPDILGLENVTRKFREEPTVRIGDVKIREKLNLPSTRYNVEFLGAVKDKLEVYENEYVKSSNLAQQVLEKRFGYLPKEKPTEKGILQSFKDMFNKSELKALFN